MLEVVDSKGFVRNRCNVPHHIITPLIDPGANENQEVVVATVVYGK